LLDYTILPSGYRGVRTCSVPGGTPALDLGAIEYTVDCNRNGIFDACEWDCGEPGGPCEVAGSPPPILGDMDRDGDVDQEDFGCFQACLSGSVIPQPDPACQRALLDTDADVDGYDTAIFLGCMTGANVPAGANCFAP